MEVWPPPTTPPSAIVPVLISDGSATISDSPSVLSSSEGKNTAAMLESTSPPGALARVVSTVTTSLPHIMSAVSSSSMSCSIEIPVCVWCFLDGLGGFVVVLALVTVMIGMELEAADTVVMATESVVMTMAVDAGNVAGCTHSGLTPTFPCAMEGSTRPGSAANVKGAPAPRS